MQEKGAVVHMNDEKWLDTAIVCALLENQMEESRRLEEKLKCKGKTPGDRERRYMEKTVRMLNLFDVADRRCADDKQKADNARRLALYVRESCGMEDFGEQMIRWILENYQAAGLEAPQLSIPAMSGRLNALSGGMVIADPHKQAEKFYQAIGELMREERWVTAEIAERIKNDLKNGKLIRTKCNTYFHNEIMKMKKSTWSAFAGKTIPKDMIILRYCDALHATLKESQTIFAYAGKDLRSVLLSVKNTEENAQDDWNPEEALARIKRNDGKDRKPEKARLFENKKLFMNDSDTLDASMSGKEESDS
ncbi:MAG: hypothetical protein IJD60_05535 [Clostridia bacterium]|nr:hypothetical protein [Clostridia bacterium]